jgi:hypothetical protein
MAYWTLRLLRYLLLALLAVGVVPLIVIPPDVGGRQLLAVLQVLLDRYVVARTQPTNCEGRRF